MTKSMEHPDANLLAAFAERALMGAERASVLAHLADCVHCRQIVFLSHEALEEETASADAVILARKRNFGFNWRRIAVTAMMLVAVGVVGWEVFRHTGQRSAENEAALMLPEKPKEQALPQLEATAPAPKTAAEKAPRTAPLQTQTESAASPVGAANDSIPSGIAPPAIAPPAALPATSGTAQYDSAPAMRQMIEQERGIEQQRVQSAAVASRFNSQSSNADSVSRHAATSTHSQPRTLQAENFDSNTAPGSAYSAYEKYGASPPPTITMARTRKAGALPGGGAIASSVRINGKMLALDEGGKLFVATEDGASWREIQKQWQGKATMLVAAPTSGVLLWSDANRAWMSTDGGETWLPAAAPNSTDGSGPSK